MNFICRLAIFLLTVSTLTDRCESGMTTVFLVRHAEKQAEPKDPELTAEGLARARQLASVLRSANLSACFASEFKRTQATAAPTAQTFELAVIERKAGQEQALAKEIKQDFAGKRVLFVGHSNTVPQMMKHLGAKNLPELDESDYDNLFVLQIDEAGETTVLHLHFGKSTAP